MSFTHEALLFAGELFALSAIVMALAWEMAHQARDRASLRHLVWAGAFAALVALPVLMFVVPSQIHFTLPSAPQPAITAVPMDGDMAPVAAVAAPRHVFHIDPQTVIEAAIALWLLGALAVIARAGLAAIGLRKLKRDSNLHDFDTALLPEGRYELRIAKSPNGYGPIAWGLFRPVVLLPFNAHFWPRARLHAVLLHETAHIGRRDAFSQMLSLIACALYWPNPLVWMGARMLRDEAEHAADDAVIASGLRPSSYAGELLQLASEFRPRHPALAGMPLFMAQPSALEARVKSVLAPTQQRSGVTSMDVLKIGSIALAATAALTLARPSFAQDAPPAPPSVTSAPLPPAAPAAPSDVSAPPAPAEAPTPPTPPTPAMAADASRHVIRVRESDHKVHGHNVHRVWIDMDGNPVSPEEQARIQADVEKARAEVERMRPEIERAQAEVRAAQPEIEKAQAEARRGEAEIRIMRPQIDAQVQAEMAKVQPEIDRAIAEARRVGADLKISEDVNKNWKHVKVKIVTKDHKTIILHDGPDDEAPATPDAN